MPDDLYHRDVLLWSKQQADLLRRVAHGEAFADIDWENVIDEIETVGRNELHTVKDCLQKIVVNLLRLRDLPNDRLAPDWQIEIASTQNDIELRFVPSMRDRIDLAQLYADASAILKCTLGDGQERPCWPPSCPWTLDQLMTERWNKLLAA